jgi:prepilin-type processing-associated H-X9-DG protein/prepilin-type N-terminal cleavage/methylation domain-containing protein
MPEVTMQGRPPSRSRGFTLVELLVVVGIIAILIALLMPAITKVRKHALELKCAANLHSIGQALTMYTQTYGYYPGGAMWGPILGPSDNMYALWPVRLRAFTGGEQGIFYCPAADERCEWRPDGPAPTGRATAFHAAFGYQEGEPLLRWQDRFFSYGYNIWGTQGTSSPPMSEQRGLGFEIVSRSVPLSPRDRDSMREVQASRVKVPSEMIAIADSTGDGVWDFSIIASITDVGNAARKPRWIGVLHRGGGNVLFCDGHVQWYLQRDLVCDSSIPGTSQWFRESLWNNDHISHEE